MNSGSPTDQDQDEWLINDDEPDISPTADPLPEPWRILVVDDDVDVHVVTKFSLRNASFKGRPLNFLHAYSGKEGFSLLRDTPDVALVLLDVVMETEHAGLVLARQIRGELDNQLVRVVLRTGQSGQALEQSVIVDYDINDYRTKSDLTTQKLFTTVISALRTYDSMLAASRNQESLKRAMAKIKELRFALDQHALLCITDSDGKIIYVNDKYCDWSQYSRNELLNGDHNLLQCVSHGNNFLQEVWNHLEQGLTWQGELQNLCKNDEMKKLQATLIPLLDSHSKHYHFLAVCS
jgi:PAS domain S-box-containing protein